MTEKEWLTSRAPKAMLALARRKGATDRQLRLYGCACLRAACDHLAEPVSHGVEVAEQFADGRIKAGQLATVQQELAGPINDADGPTSDLLIATSWLLRTHDLGMTAHVCAHNTRCVARGAMFLCLQAELLRCIVGNPFRPRAFDPDWRSGTVQNLATTIYDERAYEHLPILGDALEDAGCTVAPLLDHCRRRGPHARGCWVLDAILNKG